MQTHRLTVGQDGRVAIPETQPGQTVVIQINPETDALVETDPNAGPIPEEEREAIEARIMQRARKMRQRLTEPWRSADHGDLLYGEDGLPK